MVRMERPILSFYSAKTCSMRARTADLLPLARRIGVGIGRSGSLRGTRLVKPFRARNASFFLER
jgi:hypothetical protein